MKHHDSRGTALGSPASESMAGWQPTTIGQRFCYLEDQIAIVLQTVTCGKCRVSLPASTKRGRIPIAHQKFDTAVGCHLSQGDCMAFVRRQLLCLITRRFLDSRTARTGFRRGGRRSCLGLALIYSITHDRSIRGVRRRCASMDQAGCIVWTMPTSDRSASRTVPG